MPQYHRICPKCEKDFTTWRPKQKHCSDTCYRGTRSNILVKSSGGVGNYIVVYDPTPITEGGFSPGATLPAAQFMTTLSLGYLPDGMIVRQKRVRYKIRGTEKYQLGG